MLRRENMMAAYINAPQRLIVAIQKHAAVELLGGEGCCIGVPVAGNQNMADVFHHFIGNHFPEYFLTEIVYKSLQKFRKAQKAMLCLVITPYYFHIVSLLRLSFWAPLKTTLLGFGRIFSFKMRFDNPAIHPVFRNFQNFFESKNSRPKPQISRF